MVVLQTKEHTVESGAALDLAKLRKFQAEMEQETGHACFLERRIRFTDIARVNAAVLDALGTAPAPATLAEAVRLDARSRECAATQVEVLPS